MSDSPKSVDALRRALDVAISGLEQSVANGDYGSSITHDAIQRVVDVACILAEFEVPNGMKKAEE